MNQMIEELCKEWIRTHFDIEFIKDLLREHPADCVFELDAPEKIFHRLNEHPKDYWFSFGEYYTGIEGAKRRTQEFRACWQASEIYCPHEGIDRRKEYGVES